MLSMQEKSLRKIRIEFVSRKDWEPRPSSFICIKHFKEKYYRKGKNDKRYRLTKTLKPAPTIFNPNIQTSQCSSSSHVISWPGGLGNDFVCKRFAVQPLLWSLEFVSK